MRLNILTIALDAMPFITWHLPILHQLHKIDWHWYIVEGVALNVKDTGWCARIPARLSTDGTHEYLNSLHGHPRIHIYQRQQWEGKVEMCNTALKEMDRSGVLLQMDADEVWSAERLFRLCQTMQEQPSIDFMMFWCNYFLGQNIVITNHGNAYGNYHGEWVRAWRFKPGDRFIKHEPPILNQNHRTRSHADRNWTLNNGLWFDHYAYAFKKQVEFKEVYYNMPGAVNQWLKLQANDKWPVRVKDFLLWVAVKETQMPQDTAIADLRHGNDFSHHTLHQRGG